MEILTESIKDLLQDNNLKKIGYQDLLSIESLTIDGKDENKKKQKVVFSEIKNIKNLKYLELRNILVTDSLIKILENMDYLTNIIFKKCTFRKSISSLNNLKPLKQIRIENCKNFDYSYINKLNVESITISSNTIDNFTFIDDSVKVLDISRAVVKKLKKLKSTKIDKLVISHNDFKKYKKELKNIKFELIVMAENGFYIENI